MLWQLKLEDKIKQTEMIDSDNKIKQTEMIDSDNVEDLDEFHFILVCPKYNDYRLRFLKDYYWEKHSMFKLLQLLNSEWCNFGRFSYLSNETTKLSAKYTIILRCINVHKFSKFSPVNNPPVFLRIM